MPFWLVVFSFHKQFWLLKFYKHWRPRGNQLKVSFKFFTKWIENFSYKQTLQFSLLSDSYNYNNDTMCFQRIELGGMNNFVHKNCELVPVFWKKRIFFGVASSKVWCLGSEKFVLASKSNLSLATGLASWKVGLKPCAWWTSSFFSMEFVSSKVTFCV